ncbi:MAG: anthranilate phosphoribosyltransferase [Saprospiraceae bacterium]|jgi:anthranilate phosphoribosyltransferase
MRMRSYIQRVATGPELGKSVSMTEAQDAMVSILNGDIDPVQVAIYLIALRMKRETNDEFVGSLLGLQKRVGTISADVPHLVDIADPFDGFARCVPASTFLPAVLAALGLPALLQGADSVGPKYGVTHRKVLQSAGCNVDLTTRQCVKQIENQSIAWVYLDQRHSCPALHQLVSLRERMVKRSVLTTIEGLSRPIQAEKNHLMGGFVHRAYPPIYSLLAKRAGFASAMIIKGVEGGVVPSLSQVARLFCYGEPTGEMQQVRLDPSEFAISQYERAMLLPDDLPVPLATPDSIALTVDALAVAKLAARHGVAALKGEQGFAYDSLIYGASICLVHLKKATSFGDAADMARKAIDSGKAHAHFAAALL